MKIYTQGLIWLLALFSLVATSRRNPSPAVIVKNGIAVPAGGLQELRIRCETLDGAPCPGFQVYGDTFVETEEGHVYLLNIYVTDPSLLISWPSFDNVLNPYLKATGSASLFEFIPPYRQADWQIPGEWRHSIEWGGEILFFDMKPHVHDEVKDPVHQANCKLMGRDTGTETVIVLRNVVDRPGVIFFDARLVQEMGAPDSARENYSHAQLKLYNEAGEIIPSVLYTTDGKKAIDGLVTAALYLGFDSQQKLTRVAIPTQGTAFYICAQDLDELESRIQFTEAVDEIRPTGSLPRPVSEDEEPAP